MALKQRKFKAHEQHLINTVLRQAGTLWKAILEGVMNSVDAEATRCDITLTQSSLEIVDDGRGFKTEKELDEHFETFGTPHEEGDATYGEFRMGRGQMFAFGANEWTTGKFRMLVDVKKRGLDYQRTELKKPVKGCKIAIELYEKLSPAELLTAEEELKKYVHYVSIPVTLNGKVLSKDPATEKWDYDLDGAYLKLRENMSELRVYNLGVYVCGIPAGEVGCGGVLVSKKKLKLNFARNDVMRSGKEKCPVWAKVAPLMKKTISDAVARKPSLTSHARMSLLAQLLSGEQPLNAKDLQLFQSTSGRFYSLKQLLRLREEYPAVAVGDKWDMRADKAMQMKLGFVLAKQTLESANCDSLKTLMEKLDALSVQLNLVHSYSLKTNRLNTWPIKTLSQLDGELDHKYELLQDEDLKPLQLAILETCRKASKNMAYGMNRQERRIVMGRSKTANGWTDGETYIAINVDYIKRHGGDVGLWAQLGFLLTHEYCHAERSNATHQHTPEFYEEFHDAVRGDRYYGGTVKRFVENAVYFFPEAVKKVGAKLNKYQMKALDLSFKAMQAYEQLTPKKTAASV